MRKIISTPKNPSVLKQNLGLIKTYKLFILICMVYQGFTEYYFFASIFDFNFYGGEYFGKILALIMTVTIETVALASLVFVVQLCYQKKHGANIQFLMPFSVGLVLYFASGYISFIEVPAIVEKFTIAPTLLKTDLIDSTLNLQKSEIKGIYSGDSLLITKTWSDQIKNSNKQFDSKIAMQKAELKKHKRNKANGNEWAQSWIDKTGRIIAALRVEKEVKEGELLSSKNIALAGLLQSKTTDLKTKTDLHKTDRNLITDKNTKSNNSYLSTLGARNKTYRFIVFFTIFVILLCNIFILSSFHKAGVTVSYQLRQNTFDQNLFEKWVDYFFLKYVSGWHHIIDEKRKKVVPPTPSEKPPVNVIYKTEDFTKYVNPYDLETHQNFDDISIKFPIEKKTVTPSQCDENEPVTIASRLRHDSEKENVTVENKKRDGAANVGAHSLTAVTRHDSVTIPSRRHDSVTASKRDENVTNLNLTVVDGEPTEIWRGVERPLSFFKDSRRKYLYKINNGKDTKNNRSVYDKLNLVIAQLEKK